MKLTPFLFVCLGLQVVWVTATAPYLILTILLIRGLMLPGSADGVKYFITPRLDKLASSQVRKSLFYGLIREVGLFFPACTIRAKTLSLQYL